MVNSSVPSILIVALALLVRASCFKPVGPVAFSIRHGTRLCKRIESGVIRKVGERFKSRFGIPYLQCSGKDNSQTSVSKGFNVLELTGPIISQGTLVKIVKTGEKSILIISAEQSGSYLRFLGHKSLIQIFLRQDGGCYGKHL